MKNWQPVLVMLLALGLVTASSTVSLYAEEGTKAKAKAHNGTQTNNTQEDGKKAAQANAEAKKAGASGGETSASHEQESHDLHEGSSGEEVEEGSH